MIPVSHLTKYRGEAIKVLSRNLGGAIFILSLTRNRTIKVVVPSKLLPQAPQSGDIWSVRGTIERSDRYGRQLRATEAQLEKPAGNEIVKFLGLSPYFPEISPRAAWAAFRRHGNMLQQAMETRDYLLVATIFKLPVGVAVDLCSRWRDFWEQSRLRALLVSASLRPSLAPLLYAFWGADACSRLRANPYSLLPWLPWSVIDAAASSFFSLHESALERLLAAVELSLHDCSRTGDTAVSHSRLNSRLVRRLGSPRLASLALNEAIDSGAAVAFPSAGHGPVYQSRGFFRVEANLLGRIRGHSDSDESPEDTFAGSAKAAMLPTRSITLIFADGLSLKTVLNQLAGREMDSLHLLPLYDQALTELSTSPATQLRSLSALMNGNLTVRQATTIYLYGIEGFNLLVFSKIVHRVSAATSIKIVVRSRFQHAIGPGPILQWLLVQDWVEKTQLNPSCSRDEEALATLRHSLLGTCSTTNYERDLRGSFVPTSGYRDTVDSVLSEFYSALDAGSTSIVVPSPTEAHQLNSILHEDAILVAKESGKDHPTVKLGSSDVATLGEPVVCVRDIPELGLVAGSVGEISRIKAGYAYEVRYGQPVRIAANAIFELTGLVSLTSEDLQKLGLAYALPTQRCQFRFSENIVVMLTNSIPLNRRWMHKAACCATRRVTIVGEQAHLKSCLDESVAPTKSIWGPLGIETVAQPPRAQP